MLSSNLSATVGSPDSLGRNSRRRQKFWHKLSEVSTPMWTTKAVPNLTLWIIILQPHFLVVSWRCWVTPWLQMPPNRRCSPNPKKKLGWERGKQVQVISSKSQQQQACGIQGFILRFGNPTKELLCPCCWGDHKGQSLFHLLASLKATTKVTWAFH
jgi:hypothetical protein